MRAPVILFVLQLAATLFMTGIIWFVQVVHYPLFARVGPAELPRYIRSNGSRTGWVVLPAMVIELATGLVGLDPKFRPAGMSRLDAWILVGLLLLIWGSTALVQSDLHDKLGKKALPNAGPEVSLAHIHHLVVSNRLRAAAWTSRSLLLLYVLSLELR